MAAIARALAAAFLAGELEAEEMAARGSRLLGKRWRWLRTLAQRMTVQFAGRTRPRQAAAVQFILADRTFRRACQSHKLNLEDRLAPPAPLQPHSAAAAWDVPSLCTAGELAEWLQLTPGELAWFADLRTLEYKRNQGRLRHYRYRPLMKRAGSVRLIESPKPRLKAIQRRILAEVLNRIPPHAAVHGFRCGRSIKTFAAPHVGQQVVLRIDLQDFFPSIRVARVQAIFRTAGYCEAVADLLAGLCTNAAPADVWEGDLAGSWARGPGDIRRLYARPHLPQGAPASPALANLCAYRLDCRLTGLARSAGATYTRYADDLAFSGSQDFERVVRRFHLHACATAMEEGFLVCHRKTRIMRPGVRQRLAGLVVNKRLNIPRGDFDNLKATLTNCVRQGPESQNREGRPNFRSWLEGKLSFVEMVNPDKGRRLRTLFEQIVW